MRITYSRNRPSITDNRLAQRFIRDAQAKCAGCRTNWKTDKRSEYRHRIDGAWIECTAVTERQALRDIASEAREAESTRTAGADHK